MIPPKRYEVGIDFVAPVFVPVETEVGDWVKWADYARLQAEVEWLKKQYAEAVAQFRPLREQFERLQFEIEVHREGWDSNDAWEYHCKLEVAKMYAKRDALRQSSDPNTPPTAV